ncbi:MAG: cysteine--tRNA ligase, partial [Spirochaetia bacterium]|nr:cysteine--tRNA ligase [Spirochaetia bacterium]
MALQVTNSLSGEKEPFRPKDPKRVRIYTCGPTVYNFNHIGNFRSYVFADVLRRYLKLAGFGVEHTMNITDVEDKIIASAGKAGETIEQLTGRYITAFLEDIQSLRIQEVEHRPRATRSIPKMLDMIGELEKRGHTYNSNGSVYFRLSSFGDYGHLSRIDPDSLRAAADGRFEADEYTKENVRDFALWKQAAPSEPSWESPWGHGRPGWHIECSAMIEEIYGKDGIDIHTGGIDLLFPHNENEIAQTCAANPGRNFVRYWMHNEHLLVDGKKMSKSLGNFFMLRDLLQPEKMEAMIQAGQVPESIREISAGGRMARAM